uniref:C-type lectin domain-containing protein n=1 Tax=Panagrolaimus davidi TaxID=227884 RepID=A0A914Q9G2_9BILA
MLAKVENLLISTKAKVNFVQTSAYPCGESINSKKPSLMWNITLISGGEVYVISSPTTWNIMELIPFQYKSSLIAEKVFNDCSMGQTFKFPIDSQISTSSILIYGELNGNPIYISPKGINNSISLSNAFLDYSSNIRLDQLIESCNTDEYYSQYKNGKCWIFLTKPLTWKEAKNECEKRNSKLVSIFDQNDEEYLKEAAGITQYWIGLNDFQNNGKFVWDQGGNKSIPVRF